MANNTPPRSFNTVKNSNRDQRLKRHKQERIVLLSIAAVAALIVLLALILLVASGIDALVQSLEANKGNSNTTVSPDELQYTKMPQASDSVHSGPLILVSNKDQIAYKFPENVDLVLIEKLRKDQNGVRPYQTQLIRTDEKLEATAAKAVNKMLTDFYNQSDDSSMILTDCYRTEEYQAGLSTPVGYSEHHTGYVFTLRYYDDANKSHVLSKDSAYGDWIYENCYKYGIICRYDDEKEEITGVDGYEYCFRYVGVAHATYMYQEELCLEEYLELLSTEHVGTESALQIKGGDGNSYLVYYVAAEETELTTIPVPQGYACTVSGDNMGGFIVTANLNQPQV